MRQPLNLPALGESDALLRQLVQTLSQNPTLSRLLATPQLVRGATLAVVQVGDGRTPVDPRSCASALESKATLAAVTATRQ
jgi:hypothetical protein